MLVETWVAVPLRGRTSATPPHSWWDGAANWLLEGSWASEVGEPELGAGGAGARLHRVLKELDAEARVVLGDGATAPFDAVATDASAEGAVPGAWDSGWVDGTARATLRAASLAAAVTGRYAARTRAGIPALRLVLRGVWAELLPAGDGEDPTYPADLALALRRPGGLRDLRDLLADAGEALGRRLAHGFADLVDDPIEIRSQVRVFERTDGLEEVLRGLPPGALQHVRVVGEWFRTRRPAIEVLRRRADGVVELWRGETDAAEGTDAR